MDFEYSEEQQLLADSVRKYAQKSYDFESRKKIVQSQDGWSKDAWETFADMGLLGLPVADEYGGFGGGAVDMMGVMEIFGDVLVVEPFLATVLCARLVAKAGNETQKKDVLPHLVEGRMKLAFAQTEAGARYDLSQVALQAKKAGDGWELSGEKLVVIGAPAADKLVVSARTDKGISLFLVDRNAGGVTLKAYRTLDELRAADVVFKGVKLGANALLGEEGKALPLIEEAVDFATALVCAEAVGAMKFACDTTLEYLKTRKQFGVTIGTFQALQHRMVDMYVTTEQARSMACVACSKADAAADARERAHTISAAKIKIADACRHVSQEAIQLHGGMGMTEEMKVSHTFRRLTMLAQQFGDADHHLARFAAT
jgi:alkylation response protein AidB-like acyl-CoA dehydrogenase